MVIPDRDRARHYLAHLNYYRLRGYWHRFEQAPVGGKHQFIQGAVFEDALSLYVFDRQLRLLLLDAIERVEVSVRTRWAYVLAMRYGSHAHLRQDIFQDRHRYQHCLESLGEEINRSHESFIEHYRNTYSDPPLPPIWAVCEVMSLGQLSQWFTNIKRHADRKDIASAYGVDESVVRSFLHHLTHVRNLCAHHNRLWNRRFTVSMKIPQWPKDIAASFNPSMNRNLYNTLVMLGYLLGRISPDSKWLTHLKQLMAAHLQARPEEMGFPKDWENQDFWKAAT